MTMTTTAPADRDGAGAGEADRFAVLTISHLPRRLRPVVEALMVETLPAHSQYRRPVADPLTAAWCTTWRREPTTQGSPTVSCHELISAPTAALTQLQAALEELTEPAGATIGIAQPC